MQKCGLCAPATSLCVPTPHAVQLVEPDEALNLPAAQSEQAVALLVGSYLPAPHEVHAPSPEALYLPAPHASHARAPGAAVDRPALQGSHALPPELAP